MRHNAAQAVHEHPRGGAALPPGAGYKRREPETSLLYRLVAAEVGGLREALAAASPYGTGLPKHIDSKPTSVNGQNSGAGAQKSA